MNRPIHCLEFSACPLCSLVGGRWVTIEPGDPRYAEIWARDDESAAVQLRHYFARDALRGFWSMLWAQLTGAA